MVNQERLEQAFQRLQNYPQRGTVLDSRFQELVSTASDDDLTRINPHHLANAWEQPEQAVLTWLVYASHVGLFELNWESLCPGCADMLESFDSVGRLSSEVSCRVCQASYHVHFDEDIVVTFTISQSIRQTQPTIRSIAPPGTVVLGEYKGSEAFEALADRLDPYFLITPQDKRPFALLPVSAEQAPLESLTIEYNPEIMESLTLPLGKTQIHVKGAERVLFGYIDEHERYHGARTRGLALALLPAFQRLFASKTLSQRESLSIRSLTIMFTDITGSTALYQRLGDVVAYNLVRDHFEVLFREIEHFRSGVVKTIGDAVMVAFVAPEDAVQAALAVQRAFHEYNKGRSKEDGQILIKIGIHSGSAIAVNLNERLDYFGNMVNMAARIQGQSRSAEILLSEVVYNDPSVQESLKATSSIRVSESLFELSGIEHAQRLYSLAPLIE
jgi:adenylate cyclase